MVERKIKLLLVCPEAATEGSQSPRQIDYDWSIRMVQSTVWLTLKTLDHSDHMIKWCQRTCYNIRCELRPHRTHNDRKGHSQVIWRSQWVDIWPEQKRKLRKTIIWDYLSQIYRSVFETICDKMCNILQLPNVWLHFAKSTVFKSSGSVGFILRELQYDLGDVRWLPFWILLNKIAQNCIKWQSNGHYFDGQEWP